MSITKRKVDYFHFELSSNNINNKYKYNPTDQLLTEADNRNFIQLSTFLY